MLLINKKGIKLNRFSIKISKRIKNKSFLFYVALTIILFLFWIYFSGVRDFSTIKFSRREDFESSIYLVILTFLFDLLVSYSIIVLSFFNKKIQFGHFFLAIIIQICYALMCYISNQRMAFAFPLFTILIFHFTRTGFNAKKLKLLVFSLIAGYTLIRIVIYMTAARAGLEGQGLELLLEQLSSDTGGFLNPSKDLIILDYVTNNGSFIDPIYLFSGFFAFVPRVFWIDKPLVRIGPIVGYYVFGTREGLNAGDKGAGIPISFASQLAATFGTECFIIGLILTFAILLIIATKTKKYPLLIIPFINPLTSLISADLGGIQVSFITTTIGLILLQRLAKIKLTYRMITI